MSKDTFEKIEEKKRELSDRSEILKEELQEQLFGARYTSFEWGKKALIIGGSLFISYQLLRKLIGTKKKNKV